jgi:hypothetical protein
MSRVRAMFSPFCKGSELLCTRMHPRRVSDIYETFLVQNCRNSKEDSLLDRGSTRVMDAHRARGRDLLKR